MPPTAVIEENTSGRREPFRLAAPRLRSQTAWFWRDYFDHGTVGGSGLPEFFSLRTMPAINLRSSS